MLHHYEIYETCNGAALQESRWQRLLTDFCVMPLFLVAITFSLAGFNEILVTRVLVHMFPQEVAVAFGSMTILWMPAGVILLGLFGQRAKEIGFLSFLSLIIVGTLAVLYHLQVFSNTIEGSLSWGVPYIIGVWVLRFCPRLH